MARVRSFLASLGRDELSTAARTVLGLIVVFVPFGSLVLLTRVPPVRRMLQRLVDEVDPACEEEDACVVHEECRLRADGPIRDDHEPHATGDEPVVADCTGAHEVHEAR